MPDHRMIHLHHPPVHINQYLCITTKIIQVLDHNELDILSEDRHPYILKNLTSMESSHSSIQQGLCVSMII